MITLFVQLYMRRGILLTCGKHFHDLIISLRGVGWEYKTSLTIHVLLNCLYQARKVSNHLFVCWGPRFCNLLLFWYLVSELWYFPFLILYQIQTINSILEEFDLLLLLLLFLCFLCFFVFFVLFIENRKIWRYFIKLSAISRKDEDYHKFQNDHIPKLCLTSI